MDKYLENVDHLNPNEKNEMLEALNELQAKDNVDMYLGLTKRCFNTCVTQFKNRELDKSEQACVENCSQKYLKLMQRVSVRFAEENMKIQQNQAAGKR